MGCDRFTDFQRVDAILKQALEHPPASREAFLQEACGSDPELLARVRDLLAMGADDSDTLAPGGGLQAALADTPDAEEGLVTPGERFGPWRIGDEIGRGGMAVVYRAERADGAYRQQVAIKLLHRPGGSTRVEQRFERERSLLARLEHPNIARLLDGGTTEDGRAYIVMEYVEGEPIDRYCDARKLSIDSRLTLFLAICDAVQFAHRQLIVHRDIKPSNILVTPDGVPKLLDFGIAKLLEPDTELRDLTRTGLADRMLTPQYASPEQVLGEPVSIATDVHALGLLLYELLSGHRARQIESSRPSEIEKAICETQPVIPSLACTTDVAPGTDDDTVSSGEVAAARGLTPARLKRTLRGDLDNIVMMALRREPERRYATAAQMADDIRNFVAMRPVRARPDSPAYRLDRFVRRNTAGIATSIGVVVVIIGLTGFYTDRVANERNVAEAAAARAQVEAAKSEQIAEFLVGLFEAARPEEARGEEVTARDLLVQGVERAEALIGQPEIQARLFAVIGKTYHRLDSYEQAQELYQRALAIRERHFGGVHTQVADSLNDLGVILKDRGELEAAEDVLTRAVEMRRELLGDVHEDLAVSIEELGRLLREQGEYAVAEPLFEEGLAIRRQVFGNAHQETLSSLNSVALMYRDRGNPIAAEKLFREAVDGYVELLGENHLWTGFAKSNLAMALVDLERWSEAEELLQAALAIVYQTLDPDHGDIARTLNQIGTLYREQGRLNESRSVLEEAIRIAHVAWGDSHPWLAGFLLNLGRVELARGEHAAAEALLRESLAIYRQHDSEKGTHTAEVEGWLGRTLAALGRHEEAEPLLLDSHSILTEQMGDDHPLTHEARERLVRFYQGQGLGVKADQYQAMAPAESEKQ